MNNHREALIRQQFDELTQTHKGLMLSEDRPGRWVVRGDLSFRASYKDITVEDVFSVLLSLPDDYPLSPPTAQETRCRIPRDVDHHVFPIAGNLCLGFPLGVKMKFRENPCLLNFVNTLVIPFLFSFAYKERNGRMPYGELPHGPSGFFQYYRDLFGVADLLPTIGLLRILADSAIEDDLPCPCKSGKRLCYCHGQQLRELSHYQSPGGFLSDIEWILYGFTPEDLGLLPGNILPKGLLATGSNGADVKRPQKIG